MPPPNLYARVRHFLCDLHTGPRVRRAPGLPCALLFERVKIDTKLGRIAPRDRGVVFGMWMPSLRGAKRRSNPSFRVCRAMDCFASLAMTRRDHVVYCAMSNNRHAIVIPSFGRTEFCH